jgi:replication factor C subunit 3/5
MNKITYIPWVEKYRPTNFNDIVLDDINRTIMDNILKNNYFPNILLYGPPGTGKTTTIINLINTFQENNNQKNKGLMIHLNASDERGIDIIRNNINNFVNSKNLFYEGIKFIVLDEIDYMTKNAQQALKYLLQINNKNVRFCLICNYISRIDESLQNEFMRLRFNQLPEDKIINFLQLINKFENLNYSDKILRSIQKIYKSDIRSMINYIQSNQSIIINNKILENNLWIELTNLINKKNPNNFYNKLYEISLSYNIEIKNIIKYYFNYIIIYDQKYMSKELLDIIEIIMHQNDFNSNYIINFIYFSLHKLFKVIP